MLNKLISLRLRSQRLSGSQAQKPPDIVRWLVGVQAQDERGARWSLSLRTHNCTEADVIQSIKKRSIQRTWLMRGTLHYVAGEDLPWLLSLLSPTIIKGNARRYRELELTNNSFQKSQDIIQKAIAAKGEMTRTEIKEVFIKNGIQAEGQQIPYLLQRAALEGLIHISGQRGRDPIFRLVSELNLTQQTIDQDASLGKLASRFFSSRAPATVQDFAWWSGLPMKDARRGLDLCAGIKKFQWNGFDLWGFGYLSDEGLENSAHLLPPFDEFLLSYKDRTLVLDPAFNKVINTGGGLLKPTFLVNGRVSGIWRASHKLKNIDVEIRPFNPLNKKQREMLKQSADRLGDFYKKPVNLTFM